MFTVVTAVRSIVLKSSIRYDTMSALEALRSRGIALPTALPIANGIDAVRTPSESCRKHEDDVTSAMGKLGRAMVRVAPTPSCVRSRALAVELKVVTPAFIVALIVNQLLKLALGPRVIESNGVIVQFSGTAPTAVGLLNVRTSMCSCVASE
jgi:hypothetical protein